MKHLFSMHLARLRRVNERWHASRARYWLHAWLAELNALVPVSIRSRLASKAQLCVYPWPLPEGVAERRPVKLVLPPHEVLAPHISLPLAATRDLHRVLGYELDKYLPLPAEQVHFTARVEAQGAGMARVRLVAVDRERLAGIIEQCRNQGLKLVAIDAANSDGNAMGVDLLPAHLRPAAPRDVKLNRYLGGLALMLLAALMGEALHSRQATVAAMAAEVAELRQQAQVLDALRQELADTQGAARYLARLKSTRPTLSRLISELGQCLGGDTWLSQLEVRGSGELTLEGQSRHASALIGRARDCSSLSEVRFQGIIQPEPGTGLDRFSLAARLAEEVADAPIPERH